MNFYRLVLILISTLLASCSSAPVLGQNKKVVCAAKEMQEFVIEISNYARKNQKKFIVIPQNGIELCFNNADPSSDFNQSYLDAIDGIGVELLFFDETYRDDPYKSKMLASLPKEKKIMVSEVLKDETYIPSAQKIMDSLGYVLFPRTLANYHYLEIPNSTFFQLNDDNINSLSEIKNYLYLINNSNFESKEDFILRMQQSSFDLLVIDMYYLSFKLTEQDIQRLKQKPNGARRLVISYINIGAAEQWRPYWNPKWKLGNPKFLAKKYPNYDDEIIVHYWENEWKKIIYGTPNSYLDQIIQLNFDGVYLDNTEAYYTLYH